MLKNQFTIKLICLFLAVLLISTVIEASGMFRSSDTVTVSVPNGSTLDSIISLLEENNVLESKLLFKIFSYGDASQFKAGKHEFDKKSYSAIIKELKSNPENRGINVTIPEGYEQREIALLLEKNGLCTAEEFNDTAIVSNFKDYWFLDGIPERNYQLEGYLFPDTYNFSKDEGVYSIINRMLANFDRKITDDMKNRASQLGKTFDEIITMASIVEREAADSAEYKTVAGVFYNRLNKRTEANGYLQSCATVQYILKERKSVLSVADTKIDSPYNTYMYSGLPIGPVASPGIETIIAALYPNETDYLYFVADGKGNHYFGKTLKEHQNNMRKAGY